MINKDVSEGIKKEGKTGKGDRHAVYHDKSVSEG